MKTDGPLLLDRAGASKRLGIRNVRSFDRYVRPKLPPAILIGRVPYWRVADLEEWVERQAAPPRKLPGARSGIQPAQGGSALPLLITEKARAMRKRLSRPPRDYSRVPELQK